jgi:cobalt-zinc-cadmium efflux system protein
MLSDAGGLGMSLAAISLAAGGTTAAHRTFGWYRLEILASLANAGLLFGVAGYVMYEAVHRLQDSPEVSTTPMIVVAALGLMVNLGSLWLLHGLRHGSLNVRGAYLHVMGDALGSVGALGAAVVIALTGWTTADPIASILLSLLILAGAVRLMRESTDVLLEVVPRHISMEDVRRRMMAVEGVRAVHDLHVWTVTSGVVAMSGHAVVPDLPEHPRALAGLKQALSGLGIGHATIQLEVVDECDGVDCLEPFAAAGDTDHHHHHGPGHSHRH